MLGALDSGATGHFVPMHYKGLREKLTPVGITVGCANNTAMRSCATDVLDIPQLPERARHCYKFNDISVPLISVYRICKGTGLKVSFVEDSVTIENIRDGRILLIGHRDATSDLYYLPLHPENDPLPRVNTVPSPRVNSQLKQEVELKFRMIAAGAYEIKTASTLVKFLHAALGFLTKNTLLRAIRRNYLTTFPGLTAERVTKYLKDSEITAKGHMHMKKQGIRSTQEEPTSTSTKQEPQSRSHEIGTVIVEQKELRNMVASDLAGRFPITSSRGHKYIFIMIDFDSNYIHAAPVKSRKAEDLMGVYKEGYELFLKSGFKAKLAKLDNEVSKQLRNYIENHAKLDYQLAAPSNHRDNNAERAIQTFKNHFISILAGPDYDFPANDWDLLIPQATITLNLLRESRVNPKLSAYTQIHGQFNYNRFPLIPAGCRAQVHDRAEDRGSWEDHCSPGWYVGPAVKHYRCYEFVMEKTGRKRISDTAKFFPACCEMPTLSPMDRLNRAVEDLGEALKNPGTLQFQSGTELNQAVAKVQRLLRIDDRQHGADPFHNQGRQDNRPPRVGIRDKSLFPMGTIVRKTFKGKNYEGEIISYDPGPGYYKIRYTDDDIEELTKDEVRKYRKAKQKYRRNRDHALLSREQLMPPPRIPKLKLPVAKKIRGLNTYKEEGVDPNMYAMNAGSLWDEELNKFAPYRELIKHPNEKIRNRWLTSGEDEFGRLFQGFEPNGIEGMNVLRWIHKKEIPAHKSVTYPRYTVAYRPEKADPNRTRITVGGD